MTNPDNPADRMEAIYDQAATLIAEMVQSTIEAMDKQYVGFVLDNKGIKLPVEEVEAIAKLIEDVQFEFGWCFCGECFDGEDDGE